MRIENRGVLNTNTYVSQKVTHTHSLSECDSESECETSDIKDVPV